MDLMFFAGSEGEPGQLIVKGGNIMKGYAIFMVARGYAIFMVAKGGGYCCYGAS